MCKRAFYCTVHPDIELIAMALTLRNTYRQADTYLYTDAAPPPPSRQPPTSTNKSHKFQGLSQLQAFREEKKKWRKPR